MQIDIATIQSLANENELVYVEPFYGDFCGHVGWLVGFNGRLVSLAGNVARVISSCPVYVIDWHSNLIELGSQRLAEVPVERLYHLLDGGDRFNGEEVFFCNECQEPHTYVRFRIDERGSRVLVCAACQLHVVARIAAK